MFVVSMQLGTRDHIKLLLLEYLVASHPGRTPRARAHHPRAVDPKLLDPQT